MSENPRLLALHALAKEHLTTNHIPPFANPSDRGLYLELLRGVLRHRSYLDFFIGKISDRPLDTIHPHVLASMRLGLYQLIFLKTPDHAAVHETVALLEKAGPKKAKGFVNAGLREFLRQRDTLAPPPDDLSITHSFPPSMISGFKACLQFAQRPESDLQALLHALNETPRLCLRTNTLHTDRSSLIQKMRAFDADMTVTETLHSSWGFYINGHSDLRVLPGFLEGDFLVQSEASQLISPLLGDFLPGEKILDACAAPGGKTTHLVELSGGNSHIVALCAGKSAAASDVDETGKKRLKENLNRLGMSQVEIIEARAQDFSAAHSTAKEQFDKILVDAPCTGLGTIGKNPERKWMFNPSDADRLAREQREILSALWPLLKKGGVLVYSVCSLSLPEWRAFETLGISPVSTTFFWPDQMHSEGLFAVVLRKT